MCPKTKKMIQELKMIEQLMHKRRKSILSTMSTSANRLYNYNLAMMNSPPRSDIANDRIVHRLGNRPNSDARMEGNSLPFEPPRGPVKDLNAASTLTSLAKKPTVKDVGEDFDIPQRFTKSGRKKATPFPLKLMKVLSQKEYTDIVTWLPDGKAFTIVRPKAFVAEILPDFFKSAKYSSFTRKLHRWGFQRHLRGEDAGAFFHKLFLRGRLDLVEKMTCHKLDDSSMDMKEAFSIKASVGAGVSFRGASNSNFNVHETQSQLQQQLQQLQQMQMQLQSLQQQQQQQQQQNMVMQQQQEQLVDELRPPIHHQSIQAVALRQESKDGNSVDRLNAAIELEVNRRLHGRIQAANERFVPPSIPLYSNPDRLSLSRQALAMNLSIPSQVSQYPIGSHFTGGSFQGLQNILGGQDSLNARQGMSNSLMESDGSLPRY